MKGPKLIARSIAFLLIVTSCTTGEAVLQPDPADPTELLECETHQHLELSGSDYELVSSTPTDATFAVDVPGQRQVAKSSRYSQTIWLAYDDADEVVGVLTFWEEPGTEEYRYHVEDLYVCTST